MVKKEQKEKENEKEVRSVQNRTELKSKKKGKRIAFYLEQL